MKRVLRSDSYQASKATQANDIAKALDLNRNFEDHAP